MAEFVMPTLGADMTVGTLLGWMKKPGDEVKRGEIIAEVDTDKGLIEVEVFTSGVIEQLLIQPGAEVPVGTVLAIIRENEKPLGPEVPEVAAPVPTGPTKAPTTVPPLPVPSLAGARVHASPLRRNLQLNQGLISLQLLGQDRGAAYNEKMSNKLSLQRPRHRHLLNNSRGSPECAEQSARRWPVQSERSRITISAPR